MKKQTAKKMASEPTILDKVERWLKARQAIQRAERVKEELEPAIKEALKASPGKFIECGTSTLELSEFERDYLDAKAAEMNLGKAALAPFWKKTKVTQIRVK